MPYRVEKRKGHKNSKGQPAEFVIVNKETGQVVGSAPTLERAKRSIRARHAAKGE